MICLCDACEEAEAAKYLISCSKHSKRNPKKCLTSRPFWIHTKISRHFSFSFSSFLQHLQPTSPPSRNDMPLWCLRKLKQLFQLSATSCSQQTRQAEMICLCDACEAAKYHLISCREKLPKASSEILVKLPHLSMFSHLFATTVS